MSSTQYTNKFTPAVLINGNNEQIQEQLKLWQTGDGSSVFVRWVPDEFDESLLVSVFRDYGKIDRIDLVPKIVNNKKVGTMAFVHFAHWWTENRFDFPYDYDEDGVVDVEHDTWFQDTIVEQYPNPLDIPVSLDLPDDLCTSIVSTRKIKTYVLKCCINTRPIPAVEFNASQLTDMFQRLNTEFVKLKETFQEENGELHKRVGLLKEENATLRARMTIFELKLASVAKPQVFAGLRPNAPEFTPNH